MTMIISGAALALTGALAAACFVKAFGIAFLGLPRSREAEGARESSLTMLAAMAMLTVLCLVLGIAPALVIGKIADIGLDVLADVRTVTGIGASPDAMVIIADGFSAYSPVFLALLLIPGALALFIAVRLLAGRNRITVGDPWDCGLGRLTPRMQYSATAFTHPIRVIFQRLYRPTREIRIRYRLRPIFVETLSYHSAIGHIFEQLLYRPVMRALQGIAGRIRVLQSGSLHLYLGYILATMIVLLLVWR